MALYLLASSILLTAIKALPQGTAPNLCTATSTDLGIDATVTDYEGWVASMSTAHSVGEQTGVRVPIHTSIFEFPELGTITAYGYYDSHALTSAGYKIITNTITITTPCATATPTLPPSPIGSVCSPHGDHCESGLVSMCSET